MSIYIPTKMKKAYVGTAQAKKMFLGSTQIWVATEQIFVPTVSGSYTYNGIVQTVQWSGYDSSKMTLGGTTYATNAGSYTATFTPKEGYSWDAEGNDVAPRSVSWSIAKAANPLVVSTNSLSIAGVKGTTGQFTFSTSSPGAITVSSSNTSVATVSGNTSPVSVAIISTGSVTITVSQADSTNYYGGTKTVAVTTVKHIRVGVTRSGAMIQGPFCIHNGTNYIGEEYPALQLFTVAPGDTITLQGASISFEAPPYVVINYLDGSSISYRDTDSHNYTVSAADVHGILVTIDSEKILSSYVRVRTTLDERYEFDPTNEDFKE